MAIKSSGLGRGLDAIFLDNTVAERESKSGVMSIKLSLIDPRADQPRKYFDKEALRALASSIEKHGVFQPILVREYGNAGRYQIIAGERRFRASKLAGLTEIPAILLEKDDAQTARIALVENLQREDLNPVEEAMAYRSLAKEYSMTQEELSEQVGKSRSAIANTLRLLDLPDEVLALVAEKTLSQGHARTLLGLQNAADIPIFARVAIAEDWSVRRLEEEVKRANKPKTPKREQVNDDEIVDYFREMELRIQSHLGRVVKIQGKGRKKSVTLFYEDNEDLEALLSDMCGKEFMRELETL